MTKKKIHTKEVDGDAIKVAEKWLSNAVNKGRFKGKRINSDLSKENLYTSIDVKYNEIFDGFLKIYNEAENKIEAKNKLSMMVELMINEHKQKLADPTSNNDTSNYEIEKLNEIKIYINALDKKKKDVGIPTSMDIAIFCRIIDDAKIKRIANDTQEKFCKQMCKDYGLSYSDRVRISFTQNSSPTNKQLLKAYEKIVLSLDEKIKTQIEQYINSKTKLYV